MGAMIDVQCKCGKRMGWYGRFVDRPACPKCGDRPPQESLEETDRRMDHDRQLFETHPQRATLEQLWELRVKAGLTLRQAAKVLGVEAKELSDVEWGRTHGTLELMQAMAEAYGIEEEQEES